MGRVLALRGLFSMDLSLSLGYSGPYIRVIMPLIFVWNLWIPGSVSYLGVFAEEEIDLDCFIWPPNSEASRIHLVLRKRPWTSYLCRGSPLPSPSNGPMLLMKPSKVSASALQSVSSPRSRVTVKCNRELRGWQRRGCRERVGIL